MSDVEKLEKLSKRQLIYIDPEGMIWATNFSRPELTSSQVDGQNLSRSKLAVDPGVQMRCNDIPVERTRRTKAFDFIEREGTYVQDNLMESEVYALSIYFIGADHTKTAERFERALALRGPGEIQFPTDSEEGGRPVLPVRYKRNTRFVEGLNRTVFEVQFRKTLPPKQLILQKDEPTAAEAFLAAQQAMAGFNTVQDNPEGVKAKIRQYVESINSTMRDYVDRFNETKNQFDSTLTAIDTGINNVFSKPLVLAGQLQTLLTTPRFTSLSDTATAYKTVISSFKDQPSVFFPGANNVLNVQALLGMSCSTALMDATLSADFLTRQEAVDAFELAKAEYTDFLEYLTNQEELTAEFPLAQRFRIDPSLYEAQYRYLTEASGSVDSILAGLRQEAVFTAEEDTTPINLAAKHYPADFTADHISAIAFFERTNGLFGDDIFFIERGSEYKVLI